MNLDKSIAVFDSGVGGLTVVRTLMERLPFENIDYLGDTARVPYGVKSVPVIKDFTAEIMKFLSKRKVKAFVIACNTISAVAIDVVREMADNTPVIDVISCGAKTAIEKSKSRKIAVIATPTTINSNCYAQIMHSLDPEAHIYSKACPLFVPLIEEGWLDHKVTKIITKEYITPILAEDKIDTLVLGCTHYPLIKPLIKKTMAKSEIEIIDSSISTASHTAKILDSLGVLRINRTETKYNFFVTDAPSRFQIIGERFLGRALSSTEKIHL